MSLLLRFAAPSNSVTATPGAGSLSISGIAPDQLIETSPGKLYGQRALWTWDRLPGSVWQLTLSRRPWAFSTPPVGGATVVPGVASLTMSGLAPTVVATTTPQDTAQARSAIYSWQRLPGDIWAVQFRRAWTYTTSAPTSVIVVPDTAQLRFFGPRPTVELPVLDTTTGARALFTWERFPGGVWNLAQMRRSWAYTSVPLDSGPVIVQPVEGLLQISAAGAVALFDTARPAAGSLTFTGAAPSLTQGRVLLPPARALTLSGLPPKLIEAVLGAVGRISVNSFAPVAGFSFSLSPAFRALRFHGFVPEIDGISPWTPVEHPPTPWLDDAPPATAWSGPSRPPTAWTDDSPPSTTWSAGSPPATPWTDDSPPSTTWAPAGAAPATSWSDDVSPATPWTPSSPPATAWTDPASPNTPWRELRAERAWETEKLDVTKTEEWDIPTEQMGGGTPRTQWTRVDED